MTVLFPPTAAALYYIAELVEEYSTMAKKTISWMILFVIFVYVIFIFCEDLSWTMIICGLLAQGMHGAIMNNFPFIDFLSVPFVGSIVMLLINHFLAFKYFTENHYEFSEVLAYFTLCMWLVPFALFVSLNANDNVLPTTTSSSMSSDHDVVSNYFSSRGKKQGIKSLFGKAKESLLPSRNKKSF